MLKEFQNFWGELGWLANAFTIILGVFTLFTILFTIYKGSKIIMEKYQIRKNKLGYISIPSREDNQKIEKDLNLILANISVWKLTLDWLENNEEQLIKKSINALENNKRKYQVEGLNTKEEIKSFTIGVNRHFHWIKKSLKKGNSEIDFTSYLDTSTLIPETYCGAFRLIHSAIDSKPNDLSEDGRILILSFIEKIESYYC